MKRNLFLLLALLLTALPSFAQVSGSSFEMYVMNYRFGPRSLDYFDSKNITVTNMLTIGSIAQDGDKNKVDATKVTQTVTKIFPYSSSGGKLVLDWEYPVFTNLRDYPVTDSRYKTAEAEWKKLISIIRNLRPNVQIGIYGMPFRSYSLKYITLFNPDGKYDGLLSLVDFIAPSVYLQHPDEEVGRARNEQYLRDNMNVALDYGRRLHKPVYPFLWHRIQPSCDKYGHEMMQTDVFAYYIKFLANYSYNGYKASGIYWWEELSKSDRLGQADGLLDWCKGLVTDFDSYDALMVQYAAATVKALSGTTATAEPAPSTEGAKVTSFTLQDASTGKDIQTISSGATLSLADLPSTSLNVRANVGSGVQSVVFSLSGAQSKNAIENVAPYELMGDNGAWTPAAGSYTLKATPYSGGKATGTAGASYSVSFNVAEKASAPLPQQTPSFTLFDAKSKQDILTIANGATLSLADLPSTSLNVRANVGSGVQSVVFSLSGAQSKNAIENVAPYELMGDNGAWTPAAGSYTLKATPYSGDKATGTAGASYSISFNVASSGSASTTGAGTFTLMNADTDKDIQTLSSGAIVNLAALSTKNLNIRFNSASGAESVVFSLSGAQSKGTTESGAPYAVFGDESGDYYGWTPSLGSYTLKASAYSDNSGKGSLLGSSSISFSVVSNTSSTLAVTLASNATAAGGAATQADLAGDQLQVYPVPATTVLYVDLGQQPGQGATTLRLSDLSGRTVLTKQVDASAGGRSVELSLEGLGKGLYILSVSSAQGKTSRRVLVD